MNFLDNMSLSKKMLLIVAILLLPSLLMLGRLVQLQNRIVDVAQLELQGVEYAHELEDAAAALSDHRGLMDLLLNGDRSRADAVAGVAAQVDAAFAELQKLEVELDSRLSNGEAWRRVVKDWQELKRAASGLPQQESERRHIALQAQLHALSASMVERSKLFVDADPVTRYLIDVAILNVPRMQADALALRGAVSATTGLDRLPNAVRADLAAKTDAVNRNAETMNAMVEKIAALLPHSADALRAKLDTHSMAVAQFTGSIEETLLLPDSVQPSGAVFALGTAAYQSTGAVQDAIVPYLRAALEQRVGAAQWVRGAVVAGGGASLLLAMWVARTSRVRITAAVNDIVVVIEALANGEMGRQRKSRSRDEFGQVLDAAQRLDRKLHDVVAAIRSTAATVDSAAKELTSGNDNLSSRTQQLAASLEETASSMEQMTATVKQNADNAAHANRLVGEARSQAERGGAVVQRAVGAMSEINVASRKIADIIVVIDEIAFQTNLLALNAAVEAARAGEQGRGFAVVASEVRNLAQRSASAAKEIKDLINDSVNKVQAGAVLVGDSGKTLTEIMDSVKKVTDIVAEIAAASGEQSSGIEQVNRAITQMDSGTQENAALVEQSAAVSKNIHSTAQRLVAEIAFFKSRRAA